MRSITRVLIVDDSAFVRKVVRELLSRSPEIEIVGMARNGEEALHMAEEFKPDVVTCDLTMPILGGVEFVRRQMARRRIPILILTATPKDGKAALEALEAGAVDLIQKPTALASDELLAIRDQLIEKVRAAARAPASALHIDPPLARPSIFTPRLLKIDILVIGVSTGGPQALRYLLPQLPSDFPIPIAIVVHMPVGYTKMFAEKLNEISGLNVVEASEGALLQSGTAVLAQAGRHLVLKRNAGGHVLAHLPLLPVDKPHRPSVDVLFQSAAETYRHRVLGVVMTGMGDDGKQGCAWIKAQGGTVITESEQTCVIYGMPRSVVEAGLSDAAFPLTSMADSIFKYL